MWLTHEQVAVAALEVGALPLALRLIRAAMARFPESSQRVLRLQGMYYEAQGKAGRAEDLYHDALEEAPTAQGAARRLAAAARSAGDAKRAAEYLRQYCDHWMGDRDAWEELADVYLELGLYRQAAFCLEELLTVAPGEANLHVRYGDVLLTLGGAAHARTARAHFSKAVALTQGRAARPLYGLLACAAALGDGGGGGGGSSAAAASGGGGADAAGAAQELPGAAAEALLAMYRERAPDRVEVVRAALQQQGVPGV